MTERVYLHPEVNRAYEMWRALRNDDTTVGSVFYGNWTDLAVKTLDVKEFHPFVSEVSANLRAWGLVKLIKVESSGATGRLVSAAFIPPGEKSERYDNNTTEEQPVHYERRASLIMASIVRWLEEQTEPLATEEIITLIEQNYGHRYTGIQHFTQLLVGNGSVFTREETEDERGIRLGSKLKRGRRASLYSTVLPVPIRHTAHLVPGHVPTQTAIVDCATPTQNSKQFWTAMKQRAEQSLELPVIEPFTNDDVIVASGVGSESVRSRLVGLVKDGVLVRLEDRPARYIIPSQKSGQLLRRMAIKELARIARAEKAQRKSTRVTGRGVTETRTDAALAIARARLEVAQAELALLEAQHNG